MKSPPSTSPKPQNPPLLHRLRSAAGDPAALRKLADELLKPRWQDRAARPVDPGTLR
jgi:hypothetical protein